MLASHLVEMSELSAAQLCSYIEWKHYVPIQQAFKRLTALSDSAFENSSEMDNLTLATSVFGKLKEEMEQVVRNDLMLVFPLISKKSVKESQANGKMPLEMIRAKNKKILQMLEKLRQLANNFLLKPEWNADTRLFFEELFALDQMITQAIYLKENVLIPRFGELR
jgi:iron-sulfur cluster repair protein YtfE (RIC family)